MSAVVAAGTGWLEEGSGGGSEQRSEDKMNVVYMVLDSGYTVVITCMFVYYAALSCTFLKKARQVKEVGNAVRR